MVFPPIDWIAFVVAIVAVMALGSIWYSPIAFMRPWLRGIGKTQDQITKKQQSTAMGLMVLTTILSVLGVAILYGWLGRGGVGAGLLAGGFLWVFVGLPQRVNDIAFEGRSWILLPISGGYYLISHLLIGLVFGLFG